MKFTKMHGCGNDYIYVNGFEEQIPDKPKAARLLSDRHFFVGSDGLIFINPSENCDCEMEMYNSDGSRAEMCGNGVRCVAKFAYDHGITDKKRMTVETLGGVKEIELVFNEKGDVCGATVNMGSPILSPSEIPCDPAFFTGNNREVMMEKTLNVQGKDYTVNAVSMGNPHVVTFISEDPRTLDLPKLGPLFEHHPAFPNRVNTEFARILDEKTIEMRVWERGAGETWACGTGACAVAASAILNGYTEKSVTVKLLGGDLEISWSGISGEPLYMTGPATTVFEGEMCDDTYQ